MTGQRAIQGLRLIAAAATLGQAALFLAAGPGKEEAMDKTVYGFTMKLGDGREKSLADYKGKVLLLVNTASECGFTPQYEGLESLYERYKDKGLAVLAFPANDFGAQEPGTDAQIRQFCSTKYKVTFDLFAKSHVKGVEINPLYRYLTADSPFPGEISWNFNKFLVDRGGRVVARYSSPTKPLSPELTAKIEELLGK